MLNLLTIPNILSIIEHITKEIIQAVIGKYIIIPATAKQRKSLTNCTCGDKLIPVFGKEQELCCIILLLFIFMSIALLLFSIPNDHWGSGYVTVQA